jgi:nucleoside-triphosphatase
VNPKVLLTGRPGCGKTTLIKRLVDDLALPAGGFYTEEIRQCRERVGFKIVTLEGEEAVLAHVGFNTTQRVGKYGLDLRVLESIGSEAICAAMRARRIVVIDEIGPMEIRSPVFCDVVNDALDSPVVPGILGTISARSFPFTNAIKKRHDITLIEVRPNNREELILELSGKFKT